MEKNVCGFDRAVRLTVGTTLALVVLFLPRGRRDPGREDSVTRWQILAAYAGGELLITGLMQWCPMNYLLGINTCEQDWRTALRSAWR